MQSAATRLLRLFADRLPLVWADSLARLKQTRALRPATFEFLKSDRVFLVTLLALAASMAIGIDLLSSGAPMVLVGAWFLVAQALSIGLILRGLAPVGLRSAVRHRLPIARAQFSSVDIQRLHRPPRS